LDPLATTRSIGDHEPPGWSNVEGGRTQQATLFGSDLYELLYLTGRRDPIHGLLSAVEDIVVAGDRLLERNRLTEEADDIRR
jgi:hypothetical protein